MRQTIYSIIDNSLRLLEQIGSILERIEGLLARTVDILERFNVILEQTAIILENRRNLLTIKEFVYPVQHIQKTTRIIISCESFCSGYFIFI